MPLIGGPWAAYFADLPIIDEPLAHFFLGKKYVRVHGLEKKGDKNQSHAHPIDHDSIVLAGKVLLTVDGVSTTYKQGANITVRAGKVHYFEAMEDCCIFACVWDNAGEGELDAMAEKLIAKAP